MHRFDPWIYCKMFTTVASARASIISHRHFFFEVRTIKSSSLSSFEVYNTILLTVITVWYSAFLISSPRRWPCCWPTDHTLGSGGGLSTPGDPHPSLQNWPILSPPSFLLWSAPATGKSCVVLRVSEVCAHAQKHTHTHTHPPPPRESRDPQDNVMNKKWTLEGRGQEAAEPMWQKEDGTRGQGLLAHSSRGLISLCLSFHLRKMGILLVLSSKGYCRLLLTATWIVPHNY